MKRLWLTAALLAGTALTCCVGVRSDEPEGGGTHSMRPARVQAGNLARTAVRLGNSPMVLSAFAIEGDGSNGAVGTLQPGATLWNANTGAVIAQRQVNTPPNGDYDTATRNAVHDAPQLVRTEEDGAFEFYGAVSTYVRYNPPQSWICQGRLACEPFKFAQIRPGHEADVPAALQSSQQYLMPSVGISELSSASIGDVTILGGQQQTTAPYGQDGSQAYVTLHATPKGGYFDTIAGPWDFTSSHAAPGEGLEMITRAPGDDAYFDFAITRATPGQGSVTLNVGPSSCRIPVVSSGDGAAVAQQIATSFDSACSGLRSRMGAMQVQFDPGLRVGGTLLPPAAVGIIAKSGDPLSLPATREISIQCEGAIACGTARGDNTVQDVRGYGLHEHALYGGVLKLGPYVYYLMDVEQATGPWFGRGQSSAALALACFRTTAPAGDVWTWTDCAGRHPFTVTPRIKPVARLTAPSPYIIGAPAGGYRGQMAPYVTDWSARAQQSAGLPVISSYSAVLLPDGNILIVHGCRSLTRVVTACYAVYDTRNGRTQSAGTVDLPAGGGSLASMAAANTANGVQLAVLAGQGDRWRCGSPGACLMTYRYDPRGSSWTRESAKVLGGGQDAGFPGTVSVERGSFVVHYRRVAPGGIELRTLLAPIP